MLLYYSGITCVAKNLFGEIVKRLFLNDAKDSVILKKMRLHDRNTGEIIQSNDFQRFGQAIAKTWCIKNRLNADTNNPGIHRLSIQSMITHLDTCY